VKRLALLLLFLPMIAQADSYTSGVGLYVEPGHDSGLRILLDSQGTPVSVAGDWFWFNCSDPMSCNDCYFCVPAQASSWADVRSLY